MFNFEGMAEAFAAMDRAATTMDRIAGTLDALLAEARTQNLLLGMLLSGNADDPLTAQLLVNGTQAIANNPDARNVD